MVNKRTAKASQRFKVKRDGDRDIVFSGVEIGTGESGKYTAHIFRTDGGKFVAALLKEGDYTSQVDYYGAVADDAAGIAEFFAREETTGTGKSRVTRSYLNEAGKLAMQAATDADDSFREHGVQTVE